MEELEGLLRDVTDHQEGQKYQEALINLQELIHSKHLLTTEEILKVRSLLSQFVKHFVAMRNMPHN